MMVVEHENLIADHAKADETGADLDTGFDAEIPPEIVVAAGASSRKFFFLIGGAIALFFLMHLTSLGEELRDLPELYESLSHGGARAAVYFVLLTAALMAMGTPRLLFYMLGGFVFGFWEGMLWSLCGSMLGSFLAFRVARWGGRDWLVARFGTHRFFRRVVETRPTVWSVALVRLLPVSNAVINIGLALSRVGSRVFLAGTLIGFLPQGVVAVLIGSGVADDVAWEGAVQLGTAAVIVLSILFWSARRKRCRAP